MEMKRDVLFVHGGGEGRTRRTRSWRPLYPVSQYYRLKANRRKENRNGKAHRHHPGHH